MQQYETSCTPLQGERSRMGEHTTTMHHSLSKESKIILKRRKKERTTNEEEGVGVIEGAQSRHVRVGHYRRTTNPKTLLRCVCLPRVALGENRKE